MFFSAHISVNYYSLISKGMLLLLLSMMVAASAQAGEISTLRQSVDYALHNNRLLAADASAVVQARAGQDQAYGHFMPRLDWSTGVIRTDSPSNYFGTKLNQRKITVSAFNPTFLNSPGYINNYQSHLNLSMPIYQGGALWAGKKQADQQLEASSMNHGFMRQQVIFQTISAYVHSRQAYAAVDAMKTAVGAAEKRFEDAQALQKRGVLIDSDVMDAHVHLLRTRLKLKQANNAYAKALEQLQRVMGLADGVQVAVTEEPRLADTRLSLKEAVVKALAQRSDLKAMAHAYQALQAGEDATRSAFLPHVDLVATQEWNASTLSLKNRTTTIGATVSMNLFAGGSDRAKIRAAQAKITALELQISDHKQQIRHEVANAWRMLDESRFRDQSEREALKQSEESLRIKSLRYEQGLTRTSDLLDSQSLVDQTRLSSIGAKYDVTISRAALLLAMGMLDEGAIR